MNKIIMQVVACLYAVIALCAPAWAIVEYEHGQLASFVSLDDKVCWVDTQGISVCGRKEIMRHIGVKDRWGPGDFDSVLKALESLGWEVESRRTEEMDGSKIYEMKRPLESPQSR